MPTLSAGCDRRHHIWTLPGPESITLALRLSPTLADSAAESAVAMSDVEATTGIRKEPSDSFKVNFMLIIITIAIIINNITSAGVVEQEFVYIARPKEAPGRPWDPREAQEGQGGPREPRPAASF